MFTSTKESKHLISTSNIENNRFYFSEDFLNTIKKHEGFKLMPYNCSANHKTIGVGHIILETDNFIYPLDSITVNKVLKLDLLKAYHSLELQTPIRVFKRLSNDQKQALTKLIFSIGSGNYNKSTLKKCINNNLEVETAWLSWCKYTNKQGVKVTSDYMLRLRQYELNLYKQWQKLIL
jgi:GH24 family phage-related lysozyme (muramidase)